MLTYLCKFAIPLLLAAAAYAAPDRLVTSDTVNASGMHTFVVTNNSNAVLTGMTIRDDDSDANGKHVAWGIRFFDCFLTSDSSQLAPGQSHTFDMGNARKKELRVDAAIFADGYAEGDQEAIQYLWDRRKWMAIGYQEVFQDFETKVADINDRAAVIAALTQLKDTRMGPKIQRGMWHSISNAYDTVIGNIRENVKVTPAEMVATLRKQMEPQIQAIQSQIPPPQVQP